MPFSYCPCRRMAKMVSRFSRWKVLFHLFRQPWAGVPVCLSVPGRDVERKKEKKEFAASDSLQQSPSPNVSKGCAPTSQRPKIPAKSTSQSWSVSQLHSRSPGPAERGPLKCQDVGFSSLRAHDQPRFVNFFLLSAPGLPCLALSQTAVLSGLESPLQLDCHKESPSVWSVATHTLCYSLPASQQLQKRQVTPIHTPCRVLLETHPFCNGKADTSVTSQSKPSDPETLPRAITPAAQLPSSFAQLSQPRSYLASARSTPNTLYSALAYLFSLSHTLQSYCRLTGTYSHRQPAATCSCVLGSWKQRRKNRLPIRPNPSAGWYLQTGARPPSPQLPF